MRVTRENLIRIARETAQKQAFSDPSLVAAYLTGSLRTGDPLLGGAADIDIVFVQNGLQQSYREIVPLIPEIHLDILHQPRSEYDKPKTLRVHPWLGPELYDPLPLGGTNHFFEFVQASVRDKYHEPENILQRSRSLAGEARTRWSRLQIAEASGPEWLLSYLTCLFLAANAFASLAGDPLSERRLLLEFPTRAESAGLPEIPTLLFHLAGAGKVDAAALRGLLPAWEDAYLAAAPLPVVDRRVSIPRLRYYKLPFEAFLAGDSPQAVVWPLLLTWTLSISVLPPDWVRHWQSACNLLGLEGPALAEKMDGLDKFIDSLEETLENRSAAAGL